MTAVRIGVLGLGFMGQRYAAIAADLPAARLVSVCDSRPNLAQEVADKTGATSY
ncbi:MAG: Gfo/Idh/MocA family oxidoreductase, partial [Nocardioidaceae bacterium]